MNIEHFESWRIKKGHLRGISSVSIDYILCTFFSEIPDEKPNSQLLPIVCYNCIISVKCPLWSKLFAIVE